MSSSNDGLNRVLDEWQKFDGELVYNDPPNRDLTRRADGSLPKDPFGANWDWLFTTKPQTVDASSASHADSGILPASNLTELPKTPQPNAKQSRWVRALTTESVLVATIAVLGVVIVVSEWEHAAELNKVSNTIGSMQQDILFMKGKMEEAEFRKNNPDSPLPKKPDVPPKE